MRYEVHQISADLFSDAKQWAVFDNAKNHYIVANDAGLLESAAHIIAFALNAVADGHCLSYVVDIPEDLNNELVCYEGPTEGVAP